MKTKSNAPKTTAFDRFRTNALSAEQTKQLKGGSGNTIIIEEITAG